MKKILIVLCAFFITSEVWGQNIPARQSLSWEVVEENMRKIYIMFTEARRRDPKLESASSSEPHKFNLGIPSSSDYAYKVYRSISGHIIVSFEILETSTLSFNEVADFLNAASHAFYDSYGRPNSRFNTARWSCRSWYQIAEINYVLGEIELTVLVVPMP